jgi:hypothetical protein
LYNTTIFVGLPFLYPSPSCSHSLRFTSCHDMKYPPLLKPSRVGPDGP